MGARLFPNDPREVVGGERPTNDGTWPWWKLPKDQWPYRAPWGIKVFGTFQHARVQMPENFSHHYPPLGVWKVNTPTKNKTGAHQLSSIKVNMPPEEWLAVTPHPSQWQQSKFEEAIRQMSRVRPVTIVTEDGSITLKSVRSPNWNKYQNEIKARRIQMATERQEKTKKLLAKQSPIMQEMAIKRNRTEICFE